MVQEVADDEKAVAGALVREVLAGMIALTVMTSAKPTLPSGISPGLR
jgi:hypothetical protein